MKRLSWTNILLGSLVWPGCLTLLLFAPAAFADGGHPHGKGHHPHGDGHHGSTHHKSEYSGGHGGGGHHGAHGKAHHGKAGKHGYGGQHGYGKGRMGPHRNASEFIQHILKFKDGMAITGDQETKLKDVELAFKKARISKKANVELANLELHELLKQDQTSLSDIETKLRAVHNLKADLYLASIKAKREAKAILTEEQRKRMDAVHERIKAHSSGATSYKGHSKNSHAKGYKHHGTGEKSDGY